jgi:branched-chain amino acid aminotransferase
MEIQVTQASAAQRKPKPTDETKLGFGLHFSDHMFLMSYDPDHGWHAPRIEPYHDLTLSPAAMVLHYAQEVFEGMKAYRGTGDGVIRLFRPAENLARFNRSCERLVIPEVPVDVAYEGLRQLVRLDRDWVPHTHGCALYLRPNVIAIDPFLGVRSSSTFLYYIIVGPVGAYYPEGFNPVSIFVSDEYVRAVRGGIGEAKTGANYAASLKGQMQARKEGFSQVLWLDALERRYVEEVGTMNIFFRIGEKVYTSPLTGSILPGVTRSSVIARLRHWGVPFAEERLAIDDVLAAARSGELKEVFGSGTAAVIAPVKDIAFKEQRVQVADGKTGAISQRLYDAILGIQYGTAEDPFGWTQPID